MAKSAFDGAASSRRKIVLSVISLAEVVYLVEENRLSASAYADLQTALRDSDHVLQGAPVTAEIIDGMRQVRREDIPDMKIPIDFGIRVPNSLSERGLVRPRCYTGDVKTQLALLAWVAAVLMNAESVAGLKWTAPAGWQTEGSRPMRAATYTVPAAPGDSESAECVVYFFGAGSGGAVEANIERWKGQILKADGKVADAQIQKRTVHSLPVTMIDSSGTYTGMGGPTAPGAIVKRQYRMIGAVIENPGGNLFVKFTGPVKTVTANKAKFDQLLLSFEKN